MKLTEQEQGVLLLAARESIHTLYDDIPMPKIDYRIFPRLKHPSGAFVTLHQNDELRGCIGYIFSDLSLFDTVCEAAKLAASSDPRFPPVEYSELSSIVLEISVLSPPAPISNYNEIIIGTHGLILEEDYLKGVLLPQVAVENNFDLSEYLSALCRKTGVDESLWQQKFLNISTFTADVFAEIKHWNITGAEN